MSDDVTISRHSFTCWLLGFVLVTTELTQHYHKCLMRCRELHRMGAIDVSNLNDANLSRAADRVIYSYALEMVCSLCSSAFC